MPGGCDGSSESSATANPGIASTGDSTDAAAELTLLIHQTSSIQDAALQSQARGTKTSPKQQCRQWTLPHSAAQYAECCGASCAAVGTANSAYNSIVAGTQPSSSKAVCHPSHISLSSPPMIRVPSAESLCSALPASCHQQQTCQSQAPPEAEFSGCCCHSACSHQSQRQTTTLQCESTTASQAQDWVVQYGGSFPGHPSMSLFPGLPAIQPGCSGGLCRLLATGDLQKEFSVWQTIAMSAALMPGGAPVDDTHTAHTDSWHDKHHDNLSRSHAHQSVSGGGIGSAAAGRWPSPVHSTASLPMPHAAGVADLGVHPTPGCSSCVQLVAWLVASRVAASAWGIR